MFSIYSPPWLTQCDGNSDDVKDVEVSRTGEKGH
jgi:hypothetical protein